jgi:Mg-chelatase subunit ChlD
MRPTFDQSAYPAGEDPNVRLMLELEVKRSAHAAGVSADLFLVLDVSRSMNRPDRYPLLRRAVGELLRRMELGDRVGIALFSTGADLVMKPQPVAQGVAALQAILNRMDSSPIRFGKQTTLAPGLRAALACLDVPAPGPKPIRRVYVLTDGELHDTAECEGVLASFRSQKIEVHVYGFGTGFDPTALKRLLSGQLGGSVKPICNEQDIVSTFGHIAEVNKRLVARGAVLDLQFNPLVACGDAWTYRPQQRYLGPIRDRQLRHELGGLEAGRVYALLIEAQLPPDASARTPVVYARLTWQEGEPMQSWMVVEAPRLLPGTAPEPSAEVQAAYKVLDALRRPADGAAQLAAARASRALAVLEHRLDPAYLAALDLQIAVLEGKTPAEHLDEEIRRYLVADWNSSRET